MMMRALAIVPHTLFALGVLSPPRAGSLQTPTEGHEPSLAGGAATFDPEAPSTVEVVRAKTGHLLVRPTINGQTPGLFILDTGAGICVISTPKVESLGLATAGEIGANGVGGSESASLYRASALVLGPLTLQDHPLMATDLSFLEQHLGAEIAGVIGYGVLSRCVAEIDLVTPSAALHDPASFVLEGCEWVPLDLSERIPAVRARFEDHEGLFQLDTGANVAITFQDSAVRKWNLLENRELADTKLGGVGGFVAAKSGIVEWFELGGVRQEEVSGLFLLEAKGAHAGESKDGTIGAELLRPFVLVTDYAKERIAFRPRQEPAVQDGR